MRVYIGVSPNSPYYFDPNAGVYAAVGVVIGTGAYIAGAILTDGASIAASIGIDLAEAGAAAEASSTSGGAAAIEWPPNNGFADEPVSGSLQPGQVVQRYGSENGTFLAPAGTPFAQSALPGVEPSGGPSYYQIINQIDNVQIGTTAPAFGQPGGGHPISY